MRKIKDSGMWAVLGLVIMALGAVLLSSYLIYIHAYDKLNDTLNERIKEAVVETERVFLAKVSENQELKLDDEQRKILQGRLESIRLTSNLESLFVFDQERKSVLDAHAKIRPGKRYTYLQIPNQVQRYIAGGEAFALDRRNQAEALFRCAGKPIVFHGKALGWVYAQADINTDQELAELHRNWLLATIFSLIVTLVFAGILLAFYRHSRSLEKMMQRQSRLELIHRLSAGIAHDIKNPLAVITSSVDSLQLRLDKDDTNAHKFLDFIQRGSGQILEITENLLGTGKSMNPEYIEVKPFLTFLIKKFQPMASSKAISMQMDWGDANKVWACPTPLRMAFSNILHNAIEAVSQGDGRVHIGLRKKHAKTGIAISDNGPGISKKLQKKIFDPLVTTKKGGSGLGLPVAQQLLEDMNGLLILETAEGKGSTFILWLPMEKS